MCIPTVSLLIRCIHCSSCTYLSHSCTRRHPPHLTHPCRRRSSLSLSLGGVLQERKNHRRRKKGSPHYASPCPSGPSPRAPSLGPAPAIPFKPDSQLPSNWRVDSTAST
ncbi:hypothetical protein B0H19DRAFT_535283 [Mycena capillaripes]|nr:hypothetical protein B0H19DRAFT_535283 [Mycena capillaripes]